MSEDPKRKSERKHEKQPFLARGEEERKKGRAGQMTSCTLSMDARGRKECLIGCTDGKLAAAIFKDPNITRTTRMVESMFLRSLVNICQPYCKDYSW